MGHNTCKSMGRVLCVVRREPKCAADRNDNKHAGPTLDEMFFYFLTLQPVTTPNSIIV